MRDPLRFVKPACRARAAYSLPARRAAVKLNQNESPYDLPEAVKQRVLEQVRERAWSRYPDFDPVELREALAQHAGWRPDGVLAGNGSNELIEAALLVSVAERTPVVIPEPTFSLYALLVELLGGQPVRVPLGPHLEYDLDALLAARRAAQAPVVVVCSPNNPTGGVLSPEQVGRLCAESDALVLLDEAYHEFAGQTVVPLLERHENLLVLRTFSKALGLAGLRIGYLLAAPALVREVNKARLPYNLNVFSQAAALATLEVVAELQAGVQRLVDARDELAAALKALPGLRVFPSQANFILFELPDDAPPPGDVFEALWQRDVLVRDVSGYVRLGRCLRVSVGTREQNTLFVRALQEVLAVGESKGVS